MDELRRILEEQSKEMESVIADTEKGGRRKTKGRLRITHNKGTVQYFLRTGPQDRSGKYISKKELNIACEIAQKDYLLKLRHIAERKQEDVSGIYTEKNEHVRSKSEKILADKLNLMHIPYHYEKPLHLHGYGIVHPDFTILNKRTRKEYYWEHLGMMDDASYSEKAVMKIETYEKNSIFPGDSLILTYETSVHPLDSRLIELIIHKYLL